MPTMPRCDGGASHRGTMPGSAATAASEALASQAGKVRALHVEQAHFETLFRSTPDAIAVLDGTDRVLRVNAAFTRLFGYSPEEAIGCYINDLIVPASRREEGTALTVRALRGTLDYVETRRQRKDGSEVDVAIIVTPVELDGHRLGVHATYRDISTQQRQAREREHTVSMLEATLEATADAVMVIDRRGRHIKCMNRRFAEMVQLPADSLASGGPRELRRRLVSRLRNPDEFLAEVRRMFAQPVAEGFCLMQFTDGRVFEHYVRPQTIGNQVVGHVISLRDVTARHRAEEARRALTDELDAANRDLRHLVDHDPLTRLLNRRGLERALEVEQARASRQATPLLALLLDCDDFKRINDELGYQVGDAMLREVADAIRGAVRPSDHVARLGGDEFLVLLPEMGYWDGMRIGDRIRTTVNRRGRTVSESIALTASAGVCAVPPSPTSLEEVLARAYVALRLSKDAGKNHVASEWRPRQPDADFTTTQLASADRYRVVAQPIMRLADESVAGYELLSRTTIESFESPEHFFPLAQQHNMLTLVDLLCLENCLSQARQFSATGFYHVNLFPSTIMNTPIPRLESALGALNGAQVCVEITEQQFFGDSREFTKRVRSLREAGFHVALDDVGFGRTSLELLLLLDVDYVKIDRRFVTGIAGERGRVQALDRLLRVIDMIGSTTIVEGVETPEEQAVLAELGVTYAQGLLWGRPQPLDTGPYTRHDEERGP